MRRPHVVGCPRGSGWLAMIVLLLVGVAAPASASLLLALSLRELVTESDQIVVATGLGETSRWDKHGRIVSDMRVRIDDVIKGDARIGELLTVLRLGGSVGEIGMTVPGEARVATGERAVLFLTRGSQPGTLRVTSMSVGQFPIIDEQGVPTVLPSGQGVGLVSRDPHGALVPASTPMQHPTPLSEFLAVVRELVSQR